MGQSPNTENEFGVFIASQNISGAPPLINVICFDFKASMVLNRHR